MFSQKYEDLSLVIDATNMAAGATVWSNWFDGVEWVRNVIMLTKSDQQYDIIVMRRDTAGNNDMGYSVTTNQAATATNRNTMLYNTGVDAAKNGMLGYSVRFGIKNSSASANTTAKLYVQLLGA